MKFTTAILFFIGSVMAQAQSNTKVLGTIQVDGVAQPVVMTTVAQAKTVTAKGMTFQMDPPLLGDWLISGRNQISETEAYVLMITKGKGLNTLAETKLDCGTKTLVSIQHASEELSKKLQELDAKGDDASVEQLIALSLANVDAFCLDEVK